MRKIRTTNLAAYLDSDRGSARRIAKALGIQPPTISEWKHGKRPVPEEHIDTICRILGVTEDDLCNPFLPAVERWMQKEQGQMILKILPRLSDD